MRFDIGSVIRRLGAVIVLTAFILPASTSAEQVNADYAYWLSYAQDKVYPTTPPPASAPHAQDAATLVMNVSAAQAESEGRQISVRSSTSGLRDIWISASTLTMTDATGTTHTIPSSSVSTFKVWYVNITHPSYPYKVKGLQPDPLLPMTLANGERLGWQPDGTMNTTLRGVDSNTTQPFYVLFAIPKDAAPGTYFGTLALTCTDSAGNPARTVIIPVLLKVYPFSVAQRTLKTAFGTDEARMQLMNSNGGHWLAENDVSGHPPTQITETTTYHGDQSNLWFRYLSDHRISPEGLDPAWIKPTDNGTVGTRPDMLEDLLGTGPAKTFSGDKLAFNTVKIPQQPPAWVKNPFINPTDQGKAKQYYRTMYHALGAYASRAYVYPIDEPKASQRAFVQKYASFIHKTIPGAKFLLTTDPTTQKNKLVSGVDIYVERLQFFFRDSKWIKKIRAAHKQVWIYSHRSEWQGQAPVYMIDGPLAASRVQAWFAYRTNAAGILYWNVNAWRISGTGTLRDPYANPVSKTGRVNKKLQYNNGDGSLVYPGYYPALGLNVAGAGPVGSLRMEALRDGLEDYEYLRLIKAKHGTAVANEFVDCIIGAVPRRKPGRLQFPKYATAASTYESVRDAMADAVMY